MKDKAEGSFDAVGKESGTIFANFFKGISGSDFNASVAAMTKLGQKDASTTLVNNIIDGANPAHFD